MKVDRQQIQQEKQYKKSMDNLQKKLVRNTKVRENEIKKVDKFYEGKKKASIIENERALMELHEKNGANLKNYITSHENRLENYRRNLTNTQKKLNTHKQNLIFQNQNQQETEKLKQQDIITSIHENTRKEMDDTAFESQQKMNRMVQNLNSEMHSINSLKNEKNAAKGRLESDGGAQSTGDYVKKRDFTQKQYENSLKKLDREQLEFLRKLENKNAIIRNQQMMANKRAVATKEKHYKKLILSSDLRFKQKTIELEKIQQAALLNMKEKFRHELESLVSSHSSKMTAINNKSRDPFYKINTLEPIIKDNEDSYLISIKVPEHEKDNVILTPNKRTIRITFSRRYSDHLSTNENDVSKAKRSESMVRQFNVPEITNKKDIVQKYENGILSFKVKKA